MSGDLVLEVESNDKIPWGNLSEFQKRFIVERQKQYAGMGLHVRWPEMKKSDQEKLIAMADRKSEKQKRERMEVLERSGLPKAYWQYSDQSYKSKILVDCVKDVAAFLEKGSGIFISGPSGSGKTETAARVFHRLLNHGVTPFFYSAWRLQELYDQQSAFDAEKSYLLHFLESKVLFIDSLGEEKAAYNREIIPNLIITRAEECRPTVITCALNREDRKKRYGPKVEAWINSSFLKVTP
jgi:DNA replication protein DnaC